MKNVIKRILSMILCMAFFVCLPVTALARNADSEGLSFTMFGTYRAERAYQAPPRTVEAVLHVPRTVTGDVGVILGNRTADSNAAYVTVGIFEDGVPGISYRDTRGIHYSFRFENTDARSDGWVHLSIVHDASLGEVRCYLNGALSETLETDSTDKSFSDYHENVAKYPFYVGGDGTEKNEFYFKGSLKSLAVFDCVRSEDQIAKDVSNGVDVSAEGLLGLYDLGKTEPASDIFDLSASRAHLICTQTWFDESMGAYHGDYDFSLAVVGDTQNFVWREAAEQPHYRGTTEGLYTWITEHVAEKKIQYVLGLGDIVDNDFDSEWELAKSGITKMDGVVPYSLIRGQGHDTATKFNQYFATHTPFTDHIGGTFKEESVANTWQTFSFGGVDYLIFGFDFGAPDDVLAWADEVVEAHPDHRIIVTTHAYLDKDGTTLDKGEISNATGYDDDVKHLADPEKYAPEGRDSDAEFNDGNAIWQKFASKHKNVFMVLSGHIIVEDVVINQREGINGNTVTEILIDPQGMDDSGYDGGVGMVAMLYFDTEREEVAIEYYSTVQKMYRRLNVIDLNHKHVFKKYTVDSTCKDRGYTAQVCECGKEESRIWSSISRTHTYDSDSDAECNVCGKIRTIETESDSLPETATTEVTESDGPSNETERVPDTENEDEKADPYVFIGILCGAGILLLGGVAGSILFFVKRKKK